MKPEQGPSSLSLQRLPLQVLPCERQGEVLLLLSLWEASGEAVVTPRTHARG